ncbi:MAG: type II methionyl aminopeptidase [archaeon]
MDKEVIQKYKESGRIAATALQYGAKMIKPGVKLLDVCDAVEKKIQELGGDMAFPAQTSRNDIAAHYCPEEDDESVYEEGDVVKLDCGAIVDGYVSDNAVSIDLGGNKELVQASRDAVNAALKLVKPGTKISELGRAIQDAIQKYDFAPVKNLSGHGIGRYIIHGSPSIPNFDTGNDQTLQEGMSIAIEPFASKGAGMIYESGIPTVFMQIAKKPIRSQFARTILKDIETYNNLPFALRWLTRKHGVGKTKFGIKELLNANIIRGYPPLPDVKHGFISQAEHSVLVLDKPIIITKIE